VDAPDRGHAIRRDGQFEAASAFSDAWLCSLSKLTIICRLAYDHL
jgi:hypothetical protein